MVLCSYYKVLIARSVRLLNFYNVLFAPNKDESPPEQSYHKKGEISFKNRQDRYNLLIEGCKKMEVEGEILRKDADRVEESFLKS